MGRPTLAQQIEKAAAEGDMEKVKELAKKLAKKEPKVTPPKAKPQASEDYIFKTKTEDRQRKYVDEDGKEKVVAKIVPFKIVKNRIKNNKYKDDGLENKADIDFDTKVHKNGFHKKPPRPSVEKIKVTCSRCGDKKVVWPGEVSHSNWVCDDCLSSRGRRNWRD